jgi:hypothetical protein
MHPFQYLAGDHLEPGGNTSDGQGGGRDRECGSDRLRAKGDRRARNSCNACSQAARPG